MSVRLPVRPGRLAVGAWLVGTVVAFGSACESLLVDPAPATPEVLVSLTVEGAASGGVTQAFDRVNRALLRFTRPDSASRDTVIRVTNENGVARARLILDTKERVSALGVYAELRANTVPLFAGARIIRVESGTATSVEIGISPVPASIRADRQALQLQQVGDTARLSSAVLFASNDTISGLAGEWFSENPAIVFVTPAGLAVAREVGETRLLVRYQSLADTVSARVVSGR